MSDHLHPGHADGGDVPGVLVNVTAEDIEHGYSCEPQFCPIARAVSRAIGDTALVGLMICARTTNMYYVGATLADSCAWQSFRHKFDSQSASPSEYEPFEFRLKPGLVSYEEAQQDYQEVHRLLWGGC